MTVDQIILITTILILLVFFIKTNYRIDALSISALIFLVAVSALTDDDINIISPDEAFVGFANPAVMTVILVLVISSGLEKAGLSGMAGKILATRQFSEIQFLLILLLVAATLSSFINNIGAMAILLPLTLSVCNKMSWNYISSLRSI